MAVSRTHLMRHETVHGALVESESAVHLARAARHLLDAVYEVLPHWLTAGSAVWEGFRDARQWRVTLAQEWTSGLPLAVSPKEIIEGR
jgi:hypothetical protein